MIIRFNRKILTSALLLAVSGGVYASDSESSKDEPLKGPAIFAPRPPKPLTEAQKLVADLPVTEVGTMNPVPPLRPEGPWPMEDPRRLDGTWVHNQNLVFRNTKDMYDQRIPYTMEGAKRLHSRVTSTLSGKPFLNPSSICRPPGQQWQLDLNMPFQIFQDDKGISFVLEEYHGRWNIAFDEADLPDGESYMGKSVAHWDGNTLVVETTGYKQGFWLDPDGTPFSGEGKLIHRIRKEDLGNNKPFLEIITTIVDPKNYTDPWSIVRTYGWAPDLTIFKEYNCEEQIGDPFISPDAGLIPEPASFP